MRLCLVLAVIAGLASQAQSDTKFFGQLNLPTTSNGLGGLSGIEVDADGHRIWLISDVGTLFSGALRRDEAGRISEISDLKQGALPVVDFFPNQKKIDSEGLAITDTSNMFVSFELTHKVMQVLPSGGSQEVGTLPPVVTGLHVNRGLEALAVSAGGTLFAIPEDPNHSFGYTPVYSFTQAGWIEVAQLQTALGFRPTGADFGPNGDLFVLERRASSFGFQSKVRRVDLRSGTAQTVLHTGWGAHGNLEGIAAWEPPQGGIMLTMVADNNFLKIFPNELVEYHITE
ncbi:MAG: esterase-like activity of phytase family protein [Planktomarina sp.]